MPRFNGIPVEQEKKGGRFGGVPVDAPDFSNVTNGSSSANNSGFARLLPGKTDTPEQARRRAMTPEQREAAAQREAANYETAKSRTSAMGQVVNYFDELQHHGLNAVHGLAQLGVHGLNKLGVVSDEEAVSNDAAVAQRERDYQQRTAGANGFANVGGVIGEVAPWLVGVGEARAAGLLPRLAPVAKVSGVGAKAGNIAAKTGLLAGEGALMGAAAPVTEGGAYGVQKGQQVAVGAAAAPLLAVGLKGAAMGAGGVRQAARYATPGGREKIANARVAKLLGEDALPQLRAVPAVPGFAPTPAQALGTPEAVQAERLLRNNGLTAPAFAAQESSNNAALRDQVARLAGTDDDIVAAKAARKAATEPYYSQLPGQMADPTPILAQLQALSNSSLGVRPNIKSAATSLRNEIESRVGPDGRIGADVLSGLHENAGSHLGPMASAQEKAALGPLRDTIADALDAAVPGYRANLAAYARASQPLTDMAAGRSLLGAIDSGGRDAGGNQAVSLTQVKSLLSKDDRAKFKMSPDARKALEAVRDALQQRSITNNTVAATGPGTAADTLRGGLSSPMAQRGISGVAATIGGLVGNVPGSLAALAASEGLLAVNNAVTKKVGQKASNSLLAADAIEAYQRDQMKRGLLGKHGMPSYLLPYIQD